MPVVTDENKVEQAELPDPVEATQAFRALANAFSLLIGEVPVAGNALPGPVPVFTFTRLASVPAASVMPLVLVDVAPSCAPALRNCANAYALATVVNSFTAYVEADVSEPQAPGELISSILEFADPAPTCPPVATKYTMEALLGQV
jgi:hypothetical protein